MTPHPSAAAAGRAALACAALAAGVCLAPGAAQAAPGPAPRAVAATAGTDDTVRLLRSDPPDGAWEQTAPARVRLWFAGGAGRTATAKVSTPARPGMRAVPVSYDGAVLTVRVPADGAGEYRVLWFLVARDGAGSSAAGTLSYRVGAGGSSGRSQAFTIPPSATGAAADVLGATGEPAKASTPARTATRTPSRTSVAAAPAPSVQAPPAPPTAPATDPVPVWRRGVRLDAPSPAALAGTAVAGLLALALGAAGSLRLGARAAARPR